MFSQPYVDIDEWRDAPVRHRYVHGGFRGSNTRFSFYFPPKEQYDGRFFQYITPAPDSENVAPTWPGEKNQIAFSASSGAYFVETNGGGAIDMTKGPLVLSDPMITAFKANAAAAQYSRKLAMEMYGGKRPFGYAYGGSGGAYRTIGALENTRGVWDGAVPFVNGSTMAIPNMFSVRMQALRVLRDKFPQIVDAMEPGGSGNPYKGLSEHEAVVLREIENMGFPMESWFGYKTMGLHGFASLYGGVLAADPTYFTDFWTKPGYLGFDHPEYFKADRVQFQTTIAAPVTVGEARRQHIDTSPRGDGGLGFNGEASADEEARVTAFRLTNAPPPVYFLGGDLRVVSGAAKGQRLTLSRLFGDVVVFGIIDPKVVAQIKPGDEVVVDNSNFLAMESYHRHQVPAEGFKVWDQFRKADGTPLYPQRKVNLGPIFTRATSGTEMSGIIDARIILVASMWDREAMPWQADWYRARVAAHFGAKADDHVRLWYTEHAVHWDDGEDPSRIVEYTPVLQQALRDLAAWVETGRAPPVSTNYRIEKAKVLLPAKAADRRGIQPVVTLAVNGGRRAEVRPGEPVTLTGTIEVPPGTGSIVSANWDVEGLGTFPQDIPVPAGARTMSVSVTHRFSKPGTYFPALRGFSERNGDRMALFARVRNLERVRVVVK